MEIWKEITDYEKYSISNLGRVKSNQKHKKEIILKNRISNCGYNRVCLQNKGNVKHISVHRLVALLFIENPKNKPQVNHKNLNKKDNRVDNLEWMTASENMTHSVVNGRNLKHLTVIKLSSPPEIYHSIVEASKATGIDKKAIGNCIRGKSKTSGGYKWKKYEYYKNDSIKSRYQTSRAIFR